jgi:hypothetical protein
VQLLTDEKLVVVSKDGKVEEVLDLENQEISKIMPLSTQLVYSHGNKL